MSNGDWRDIARKILDDHATGDEGTPKGRQKLSMSSSEWRDVARKILDDHTIDDEDASKARQGLQLRLERLLPMPEPQKPNPISGSTVEAASALYQADLVRRVEELRRKTHMSEQNTESTPKSEGPAREASHENGFSRFHGPSLGGRSR